MVGFTFFDQVLYENGGRFTRTNEEDRLQLLKILRQVKDSFFEEIVRGLLSKYCRPSIKPLLLF